MSPWQVYDVDEERWIDAAPAPTKERHAARSTAKGPKRLAPHPAAPGIMRLEEAAPGGHDSMLGEEPSTAAAPPAGSQQTARFQMGTQEGGGLRTQAKPLPLKP